MGRATVRALPERRDKPFNNLLESRGSIPVSPPRSATCARSLTASDPLQFLGYTSYQAKSNFSKMRSKPFPPSLPLGSPALPRLSSVHTKAEGRRTALRESSLNPW